MAVGSRVIDLTPQLLDLSLVLKESPYKSVRKEYKEPLSREEQAEIHLICNRYIGNSGTPAMSFSDGKVTRLIVPTDLRLKRKGE